MYKLYLVILLVLVNFSLSQTFTSSDLVNEDGAVITTYTVDKNKFDKIDYTLMATYVVLNVIDVVYTNEALKNPNVYEANPLMGKNPSLEKMILYKALSVNAILYFGTKIAKKNNTAFKAYMILLNTGMGYVCYHNYNVVKVNFNISF